jgi:hypothetical protein
MICGICPAGPWRAAFIVRKLRRQHRRASRAPVLDRNVAALPSVNFYGALRRKRHELSNIFIGAGTCRRGHRTVRCRCGPNHDVDSPGNHHHWRRETHDTSATGNDDAISGGLYSVLHVVNARAPSEPRLHLESAQFDKFIDIAEQHRHVQQLHRSDHGRNDHKHGRHGCRRGLSLKQGV